MNEIATDTRLALLERDVNEIKEAIKSIAVSNSEISRSLQTIAVLETEHANTRQSLERAFSEIASVKLEVAEISRDMPGLKEIRGWVVTGVLAVAGIVGAAMVLVVVRG